MSWISRVAHRRAALGDEAGFTLVESMVALIVAALVFTAVAVSAMTAIRSAVTSRLNQQAADIVNRQLEEARGMSFGAVTMVSTDLSGDPTITPAAGSSPATWNVPGVGSEAIDAHATGSISPHVTTVTTNVNHAVFTVKRYVTVPSGTTYDESGFPSVKRFTAQVSWSLYGHSHTRTDSTLITETVRGLPLPNYSLRTVGKTSATVAQNVTVDFGFAVHNLGARDAFNIKVSSSTGSLGTGWTFYLDNGAVDTTCPSGSATSTATDGIRECGENATLPDTDANAQPDTGYIDPKGEVAVVAERTSTSSDSGTVTFTTTSIAQPNASSASHSVSYTLTITNDTVANSSCPTDTSPQASAGTGTSLTAFYLNNSPDGNTATQTSNPLARSDCTVQTATSVPNYSTDVTGNTSGRYLAPGGSSTSTSSTRAMWYYQPASATTVNGSGALRLYFQCVSAGSPVFNVSVGTQKKADGSANAWVEREKGTATVSSCSTTGWQTVDVPLSLTGSSGSWSAGGNTNTSYIGIRLWTTSTSPPVRLLYDYSNYVSYLVLAVNP